MRTLPLLALLPPILAFGATACQGDGTIADDDSTPEQVGGDDDAADDDAADDDTADDDAADDDAADDDATPPGDVVLVVNEFMASNASTIQDEGGSWPDWIEIWNAGSETVDLEGYGLTDDLQDPTKWTFPAGVRIDPDEFLLVWADGDVDEGSLHAGFRLSASGEQIGLYGPAVEGSPALDTLEYGAQSTDVSMARSPDGAEHWEADSSPTPGRSNG